MRPRRSKLPPDATRLEPTRPPLPAGKRGAERRVALAEIRGSRSPHPDAPAYESQFIRQDRRRGAAGASFRSPRERCGAFGEAGAKAEAMSGPPPIIGTAPALVAFA